MGSFRDSMSANLSRLAGILGVKGSDKRRMEQMEHKLSIARAGNQDRLEALKEKIRDLEGQALSKKQELESARGDSKKIIAREIERIFRELDRLHSREKIIAGNLDRISIALVKLEEYADAREVGLSDDDLDDIALDLQEAFDDLNIADKAVNDLDRITYQPPQASRVESEARMAEVSGERETDTGLTAETQKRLKQLEKDTA